MQNSYRTLYAKKGVVNHLNEQKNPLLLSKRFDNSELSKEESNSNSKSLVELLHTKECVSFLLPKEKYATTPENNLISFLEDRNLPKRSNVRRSTNDEFSTFSTTRLIRTLTSSRYTSANEMETVNEEVKGAPPNCNKEPGLQVKLHCPFEEESNSRSIMTHEEVSEYCEINKDKKSSNQNNLPRSDDFPVKEETGNVFSDLFSDIENPKSIIDYFNKNPSDIPNQNNGDDIMVQNATKLYSGNNEEEFRNKQSIARLENKIRIYKNRLNLLRKQISGSEDNIDNKDDIEMEIEEFEETSTTTVPIYRNSNRNTFDRISEIPQSKVFENMCLEFNHLESERENTFQEIREESTRNVDFASIQINEIKDEPRLRDRIKMTGICTDIDVIDNQEEESFREWFSEYDQSYSLEQKNIMEKLYITFQTNRTEFVKLLVDLLAKSVKSFGVQTDRVQTFECFAQTDKAQFKNAFSGETNSINVSIIDVSKMKWASIQANPIMANKFTYPMKRNESDVCTSTVNLIAYCCTDIEHQNSIKNESTQTKRKRVEIVVPPKIINNVVLNETEIENNDNQGSENQNSYEEKTVEFYRIGDPIITKFQPSVLSGSSHGRTQYQTHVNEFRSTARPKFEDRLTRSRIGKYGIANNRKEVVTSLVNRRRNNYSTRMSTTQSMTNYQPMAFVSSNDNELMKFNDFMRSTILQGYSNPVAGKLEAIISKYDRSQDKTDYEDKKL